MVPGASLSDITGINDIIKKTEGIAYDAQYTDFVKLAKLVAESYDTAVKNLSALDESYGLTEEDIAVYAGMLAVREILCAVYGADSINLTLRGAVSNFAIVKVFSESTQHSMTIIFFIRTKERVPSRRYSTELRQFRIKKLRSGTRLNLML